MSILKTKRKKKNSQWRDVWNRLKKNKTAMAGLVVICILILVAVCAPLITDYKNAIKQVASNRFAHPSAEHWFGTDAYGRDVFARIVYGTRISFTVGFITTGLGIIFGSLIGSVAAYYGGRTDSIIMRIVDTFLSIPGILLALAIVASFGGGLTNLLVAITFAQIIGFAKMIRSFSLPIVGMEFIEASKAIGVSNIKIIFNHVLRNALGPIIVQASMSLATIVILAAGFSYLGLGVQPPAPEWGVMLAEGKEHLRRDPYLVIIPGLCIVITSLSINLLGDGLRDALDPRLKGSL